MKITFFLLFLEGFIALATSDNPCNLRTTQSGVVCVCNSTYCDTVPSLKTLNSGQYQLYTTSLENPGFSSTTGSFSNRTNLADVNVTISNNGSTHQTIMGFGGAFTDSTGINILKLSERSQSHLLDSYWGENGIQYSLGRVPIAGTDFSLRGYTYCDKHDETLKSFALEEEDFNYKIPFIHKALSLRHGHMKLFASAWSAPKWMKTNNEYGGFGKIKDDFYGFWAKYYLKFFEAYQENNITFWGVTTQNEPEDGLLGAGLQNNGFSPYDMVMWVKTYLGPAIRNSSFSDLKIIIHDDVALTLPYVKMLILSNKEVVKYLDGIGLHWYSDEYNPSYFLNFASADDKHLFRILTEACNGFKHVVGLELAVDLGNWTRGERYMSSIMNYLSYDFIGWVDWNMVLDEEGGPTWINNEVDSPIIVNKTADEFYKQPMYYALGHFSKFVTNSVRIHVSTNGSDIDTLAFRRPDGKIAVVLQNRSYNKKRVKFNIFGSTEVLTLSGKSFNTLLYNP